MHASRVWANQVISFFLHATPDEKWELINYLVDFLFFFFSFFFFGVQTYRNVQAYAFVISFFKTKAAWSQSKLPRFPNQPNPSTCLLPICCYQTHGLAFYRFAITILRNSNLSPPWNRDVAKLGLGPPLNNITDFFHGHKKIYRTKIKKQN